MVSWFSLAALELLKKYFSCWVFYSIRPTTTCRFHLFSPDRLNLCVEAHMRQLTEDGFEIAVVKDATAAAQHPELGDGYAAALINFGYIASQVLTTDEAVAEMT